MSSANEIKIKRKHMRIELSFRKSKQMILANYLKDKHEYVYQSFMRGVIANMLINMRTLSDLERNYTV